MLNALTSNGSFQNIIPQIYELSKENAWQTMKNK